MKSTNDFFIKSTSAVVFMLSCLLLACSNDNTPPITPDPEDPEEPEVVTGPEVETLVESIVANDALAIDADGNIYASNFGAYSATGGAGTHVLKITPDGTVTEHVTGLSGPLGLSFDTQGSLYIINDNNGVDGDIIKIDVSGTQTAIATIPGWPSGVTIDADGNLYVANYNNPTIHKVTPAGVVSIFADDSSLAGCVGIDIDGDGNLIAGNYNNGKILSIDSNGEVTEVTTISGVTSGFGVGYITYFDGAIYATGIGTNVIYKVDLDGTVATFAGNGSNVRKDGPLLASSFKNPNGIVGDEETKTLYILDWGENALRKIDLSE